MIQGKNVPQNTRPLPICFEKILQNIVQGELIIIIIIIIIIIKSMMVRLE